MNKEFMKIGPITCSIQAEPPYKKIRDSKTDFTIATEKPILASIVRCKEIENGAMSCEDNSAKIIIRVNNIGAEILKMCDGKKTIEQMAFHLCDKYDYDDDEFIEQVKTFLNVFKTYKLI